MTSQEIRELCARPGKSTNNGSRGRLSRADRAKVLRKTGCTCHVCGEHLRQKWQADHVVPHKLGGAAALDNYLPICRECNSLRWFHSPEVIRLIMRLGIYAKLEIRNKTQLGEHLLPLLLKRLETKDRRRTSRQAAANRQLPPTSGGER